MEKAKPFCIPKRVVWEAYKRVKANQGAAGVDGQSIEAFEEDLENNLYKLWNRLSSGSYFPPPVKRVAIRKRDGGTRPLGVPTVADRIAQTVVKAYLEPELEPYFHPDSYGYRPGKSALDAVGVARKRCWRYDWVVDLDLQAFFRHHSAGPAASGGAEAYRLSLGGVIHRAVAASARATRRRDPGSPREGHAARGGDFTLACESLLALCVRPVDGAPPSLHPVRAFRR